jgi:RNA polymerase sigma-70 factor, ECF subfamily
MLSSYCLPLTTLKLQKVTTPQKILLKGEEAKLLYESINKLKLEYQEVLILRKIKEFSIKEVSEILGWKESKVKTTTSRAMLALKKRIIKRGEFIWKFIQNLMKHY